MKRATFRNWILLGISISLALVFAIGYSSYKSLEKVREDQEEVNHTHDVISKCENILTLLVDAETGQRGFLITNKVEFLEPYNLAVSKIDRNLDELDFLVNDSPTQINNANKLRALAQQRIRRISTILEEEKNKHIEQDFLPSKLNVGKQQMDEIRLLIKNMSNIEKSLLVERKITSNKSIHQTVLIIFFGTILIFIIVLILFKSVNNSLTNQIKAREELANSNIDLENLLNQNEERNWILHGKALIGEKIRGEISIDIMASRIINSVAEYTNAKIGAIYLADLDNKDSFVLKSGHAFTTADKIKKRFNLNETWIGQVAADKKATIVKGKLNKDLNISSGLLITEPYESLIVPFYFENNIKGIVELGFSEPVTEKTKRFVEDLAELLGVGINRSQSREKLENLYEETQLQAEELETQQEELRVTNDELISKSQLLQASEEELRVQQEELREINFELEEKAKLLEDKNKVIEEAKEELTIKMKQLELSGKYKSEFLANMSHELRTPLNSILILARILKDNKSSNLSDEEAKYANVIFKAGNDLLQLINDILDLAKIESGKVDLQYEEIKISEIVEDLSHLFSEVAKNKEVNFNIIVNDDVPEILTIDKVRLEQVIKNLLSNAFKFTPKSGNVKLTISLDKEKEGILFEVADSGIGIPLEKQKLIFEAFQQADGSTSREYGGTGLGLSICKELSQRMQGNITLSSEPGKGSKFTFFAPLSPDIETNTEIDSSAPSLKEQSVDIASNPVESTKTNYSERDKPLLLIIEDDHFFNAFLKKYGIEKGFDVIQVYDGESGVEKAMEHLPDAVLLDIMLPGIDGWNVLKKLKANDKTKNIPVHMMSAGDQRSEVAINAGALSFMKKPVDKEQLSEVFDKIGDLNHFNYKNILLVEDQEIQSNVLAKLFREKNINVEQAFTGAQTLEFLENSSFDCVILDINLPDISGVDLLEQIRSNPKLKNLPIVINTAMEVDQEKMTKMLKYSNATVMKTNKSSDRLIDEVSLFLHKIKQEDIILTKNDQDDVNIEGKTILLVDDDMRNIFALSAILDGHGFKVEIANDGLEALDKLKENDTIDLVLMDIMMPKMDGFDAIREIRKNIKWKKLPIIALTAKAMKEDKENCIAAGANDYITKPIDVEKLHSLIKIWLA